MTTADPNPSNYWQLLDEAFNALDAGDYPGAERLFLAATEIREDSPGRVFFTEKLGDGIRRLMQRGADPGERDPGRWEKRAERFRIGFNAEGEKVVREGIRLAELRPEDDAETNQPVLAAALFLVARSRIFPEEPSSAVALLKGLFRTARRSGRPFPVELVRHDLPLTEEDRLWLARRGAEILEAFVEQGHLAPGTDDSVAWAEAILHLLHTRYFGLTGRLEEERCWLEAVTADHLLGRAAASVELYRAFLAVCPEPGPRADEARVRLLELLGNTDRVHFPAPRYRQALGALQTRGLAPDSALVPRHERALARIEHRRPDPEEALSETPAWASLAVEGDGRVAAVFWWDAEPRDVAFWEPGQDPAAFREFLDACGERLVTADSDALAVVGEALRKAPVPWSVDDFLAAFFEPRAGRNGLTSAAVGDLARAETGPWRSGWDPDRGHPWLEPRRGGTHRGDETEGPAAAALQAGLAWLAVRTRVEAADPSLRAGLGELARRGDPACRFLYDFLSFDGATGLALDAAFEAWTLPLLWTRPDPFAVESVGGGGLGAEPGESGLRPDLGRHDLAVVATGDPAAVLAAWGGGREKWRVVLDRLDRLESLSRVSGGAIGPVTLIPAEGTVHVLAEALDLLDSLALRRETGPAGLLPLFHWVRLVETHNGDLLDFRQIRPRPRGAIPLYDLYEERVADLGREAPRLEGVGHLDSWGGQFSQRVRKAGLVAGTVAHLGADTNRLDSLWGVFDGSEASWIFLDSAAVHWSLLERAAVGIRELHALLHSRGRRHLSVVTGAVCLRGDLDDLLTTWLGVFGNPYFLNLTDTRPPLLKLADRGVSPEARLLAAEAQAGHATWLDRRFADGTPGTILMPTAGRSGEFWRAVRRGDLPVAGADWRYLEPGGEPSVPGGFLAVPALASLTDVAVPTAGRDVRVDWAGADGERREFVAMRRGMCALELAARLAGPWDEVCILDTRWWRLLVPDETARGNGAEVHRAWSGRLAAAAVADEETMTFDLPGNQGGDLPLDARMLDQAATWVRSRAEEPAPWQLDVTPDTTFAGEAGRGVILLRDGAPDPWPRLADRIAEAWERGRCDRWLLVVDDTVPPGAAELVAAGWSAGITVWSPEAANQRPAPVLWVLPEDFQDTNLRRTLDRHPPEMVLAGTLGDWLPGPDRPSQETALALRGILDSGAPAVMLRSPGLPDSWARFLEAVAGARSVGAGPPPEVPAVPPSGPADAGLDAGGPTGASSRARRLHQLLGRLRTILGSGWNRTGGEGAGPSAPPVRQLLPLDWLGRLSGLDPEGVAEGVRLLRWTARLAGDSLSAAEGEGDRPDRTGEGHALLIGRRFAELENVLDELDQNLAVVLPLWLAHGRPGTLSWIDVERPPAVIDPAQLILLDEYLGAVAGGASGLTFACPPGRLHASRRLVGCTDDPTTVLAGLRQGLQVFRTRLVDVMSSALETPDGFLVETGLVELRDDERDFLALGSNLGFWRWMGPACPGALHLVDLLTLADSPTVQGGEHAWRLWEEELARRHPVETERAIVTPTPAPAPGRRGLRSLLAMGAQASDDLDPLVARVADLAGGGEAGSFLVLKGILGTGRHEAVARGLVAAFTERPETPRVTVHCPDDAVAAQVAREFLAHGLGGPLDLRVAGVDGPVSVGQPLRHPPVDHGNEVVILCEVQRFDPETRYRIAQNGRGRRLLMTVDPAAAGEPWDNLFLTTPRPEDVLELDVQRHQAKRLWNEVRGLLPIEFQGRPAGRRKDRGRLTTDYAANLDQGLARLAREREEGRLPESLRVSAPMAADLQYLGSKLRDRGWLAVPEPELEALFLPGPREFLAAATDALVMAGSLAERFDPGAVWQDNEDAASTGPAGPVEPDPLTERLLGPQAAAAWRKWRTGAGATPQTTLLEFAEMIAPTNWANSFLAHPEARVRCVRLLEAWGRETLLDLLDQPAWEAWWYLTIDDVAARGPLSRRPVAALAEAERRPGARWPGGCYLCLGSEGTARHYEHLARVSDDLLVLYQEHSPLSGDHAP